MNMDYEQEHYFNSIIGRILLYPVSLRTCGIQCSMAPLGVTVQDNRKQRENREVRNKRKRHLRLNSFLFLKSKLG